MTGSRFVRLCLALLVTAAGHVVVSSLDEGESVLATAMQRNLRSRIVGGSVANKKRYPYFTRLEFISYNSKTSMQSTGYCGGTLIDKNVVLTAAHCVIPPQGYKVQSITAYVNATSQDTLRKPNSGYHHIRIASQSCVHRYYDAVTLFSDVAVVFLDKSIDTKVVTPAKINGNANIPADGQSVTAIGLGATDNYQAFPKDLLEVSVSIIDGSVCEKRYILNEFYDLYQICAGGTKGTWHGDSGGPLLLKGTGASKDVVVGITSYGVFSAPGAFARASMYGYWVQDRVYDYNHNITKTMCK